MRIRSIKPEFWSHPILLRQTDEVRIGAIGLLNVADDEGYFLAEPAQIRSQLWGLDEDSTRARRVLARLTELGYIEVRESPTHGPIGLVVNFSKHQRVDRPSPSKIKTYFLDERSTNDRRKLDERSCPEQGAGSREQGAREHGSEGSAREPEAPNPDAPEQQDQEAEDERQRREIIGDDLFPDRQGLLEQRQPPVTGRAPTPEEDWRMRVSMEPWAQAIKRAGGKIGPGNWVQFEELVTRFKLDVVLRAVKTTPATDRWPDQVEATIQRTEQEAVARSNGHEVIIL